MIKKISFIFATIFIVTLFQSCHVGRYFYYNFANITDYKIFPNRILHNDSLKFSFNRTENGVFPKTVNLGQRQKAVPFDNFLENSKTVAFIIIKDDTVQYEKYFNDYTESDIIASFSMAKSITSILIGCAIDEGIIKSIDEPITNYIPELKKNGFEEVKIKHLLQMTSGIKFNESYINPFGEAASYYYGKNLRKRINRMKLKHKPNTYFEYKSGDTQLLGLVLERALKSITITQYLQEKLWIPIGMEYEASWSIDQNKNGLEKTFCCINARAIDFAKVGRLYLKKGKWNDKQIVSENWVNQSTKIDTTDASVWYYQYQWWLPTKDGDFMAEGILGQFVYVNPEKQIIMVRLGKKVGGINWSSLFTSLAKSY